MLPLNANFQYIIYGFLWAIAALLVGVYIKKIVQASTKSLRVGLFSILISYVIGLTLLGLAVSML
ncbi:MAG: hypothetical protein ACYDCN_12905 [Bacteroidia bacterium]